MSHYKTHMFVCTNQKDFNKPCCAKHNTKEIVDYAKQQAALLGLTKESKFRISSSGCMGRCSEGPALVIYPQGIWCTYNTKEDIDAILNSLVNNQKISDDLLI